MRWRAARAGCVSVKLLIHTDRCTLQFPGWRTTQFDSVRCAILLLPSGFAGLWHTGRSARQDDFAEWPILDQMAQGFARCAEWTDTLDDRLDRSVYDQRD